MEGWEVGNDHTFRLFGTFSFNFFLLLFYFQRWEVGVTTPPSVADVGEVIEISIMTFESSLMILFIV